MARLLLAELRHRPGRSLALGLSILVAAASFTLLTASASTSALHVHGTLNSSFRPAYDILVRPRGSRTPLERQERLVRPNFLSGIYGGITLAQWHRIERIRGVAVAAPSATVGYLLFPGFVPFSIKRFVDGQPNQLYRIRFTYLSNGTSRYPAGDQYVYYHPRPLQGRAAKLPVCGGYQPPVPTGPFDLNGSSLLCSSPAPGLVASAYDVYFPVKLAAIDPVQEARLLHLNRTVTEGRYLREGEGLSRGLNARYVPVLASTHSYLGDRLVASVERLTIPANVDLPGMLAAGTCTVQFYPCPAGKVLRPPPDSPAPTAYAFLKSLRGRVVGGRSYSASDTYDSALSGNNAFGKLFIDAYWRESPVSYRRLGPDHLAPRPVGNPRSVWHDNFNSVSDWFTAPTDNEDVQFRRLTEVQGVNRFNQRGVLATPVLHVVGSYDPSKLPGFSPLSRVPLETYYPPELEPANASSAKALHGKPLLPSQNLGDYIEQPPLLLTTLKAFEAFLSTSSFVGVSPLERRAPLSAIRVKVAGVTGANPLSLERIKVVAQKIQAATGLDVDITAGSSPHPVLISLPKGKFGRPALLLREGWSKKGATVSFLKALDRKDLALFALILVVCAFFLSNGAFASVRTRRGELGALLTLGWSPLEIFRAVLGELTLVGVLAGLVGTGLAAALVVVFALDFPLLRTLFVLPIAVGLAVIAGLFPAWGAARGRPLDAIRPAVVGGGHGRRVRGLLGMALVNLGRMPGRALVGAAGLLLGVAALTVLLGIERGFQGTLVGTVLGSALALQVRGTDFAALALTLALSALSAADVLYLNLRERQAELVTLRTLGWSDSELQVVVGLEALLLAVGAGVAGALIGILVGSLLLGVPPSAVVPGAAVAGGAAVAAALLASLLPLLRLRRLAAPEVLAGE